MERYSKTENAFASLFFIIPTLFIAVGIFIFTYSPAEGNKLFFGIPLFVSLVLLLIGFFLKKDRIGNVIRIAGWTILSFFWSTQINNLYFGEDGDFVNAFLCIVGIYVLFYIAYHEWLSVKRKENISCLSWIAGAGAIAGLIYFGIDMTPLQMWLREVVAAQSAWVLNIFAGNVYQNGIYIRWEQAGIGIIFACTAVQSMVIFVGMILPLTKVDAKRKIYGLLVTVLPIYLLNLVRNALVVYLTGVYGDDFFPTAHNIIGKGGSLIALVILLLIVVKIIPEVFDEIMGLIDLHKRNGPMERFVKRYVLGKKL
jgi:archaeosortase A (PGF-CTERM-specific)